MLVEQASSADGASLHVACESECMGVVTVHKPTKHEANNVQTTNAEKKIVFWIRIIVLAVLVVSTVSVALFEKGFISYSLKVLEPSTLAWTSLLELQMSSSSMQSPIYKVLKLNLAIRSYINKAGILNANGRNITTCIYEGQV
jgi:hypothetical protein